MFTYFIAGLTFGFAAAVQPGPFQLYIIAQSLDRGWRSTLPAAFAPLITDGPIALWVLLLLSRLPGQWLFGLQTAGGLFLIYLASRSFQRWRQTSGKRMIRESRHMTLFQAVMVNALNPGPYLGWSLVLGPLFLRGWQQGPDNGVALILGFYLTLFITHIAMIFFFASARQLGDRMNHALLGLSALVLACFGIYQIIMGMTRFWDA